MKKSTTYRILALTALLLAVACSKTETFRMDEGGEAMTFRSYVPTPVSKADAGSFVEGTVLPDNSSFGVFAFYQPGVIDSGVAATWNASTRKPDFMFNQQVDFDGTDYTYSPLRYWPSNMENTISFWAYYPYSVYSTDNSGPLKFYESDGSTRYTANSTGLPVAKYTVDKDPANQYDILFDSFANQDKTYDNCAPTPGVVPLNFRHALCLVDFQIAEGTGADIHSMSLEGIYWSGTCTNPANRTWENQSDLGNMSVQNLTVTSSTICSLILIPQTLAGTGTVSNAVFKLNYDITFASSDPSHPDDIVYKGDTFTVNLWKDTGDANVDYGVKTWEPGKHYIYRLSAGLDRIEFEEVVEAGEDWTVANNNISVPE